MDRKNHYKRFFIFVALFGLITSSVVYAAEASPFPDVEPVTTPINEILPDLPQLVEPEDPKPEPDQDPVEAPEPDPEFVEAPEPEKEEDPDNEEPSGDISENEVSDNTVSGQDPVDQNLVDPSQGSSEDFSSGNNNGIVVVVPSNVNADNYYNYALSMDSVKIQQLSYISENILSINEVLRKHEEVQKDIFAKLSGIDRNEQAYKKAVLEFILSFKDSLSGNKIKVYTDEISVSVDASAIGEYMSNTISENDPEETVSGNDPAPDPEETVSDDDIETLSDNVVSISKGDIEQLHKDNEQLHDDLKSIFYVSLFGVIFLAMIAAGNLEQIIFKRLRG